MTRRSLIIRVRRCSMREVLYLLVVCVNLCMQIVSSSNIRQILFWDKGSIYQAEIKLAACALAALFVMQRMISTKKFLFAGVAAAAVLLVTLSTRNLGLALVFFLILAYPDTIDLTYMTGWVSRCYAGMIALIVGMDAAGLLDSGAMLLRGETERQTCGFSTANGFSNTVALWMLAYWYAQRAKWRWWRTAICFAIACAVFYVTRSRAAFAVECVLLAVQQLWQLRKRSSHRLIYLAGTWSFPALLALSMAVTQLYRMQQSPYLIGWNELLSYRLDFMQEYWEGYGLSLFGRAIVTVSRAEHLETGKRWCGLDNSYMYMLICWGIAAVLVMCVLYFLLGRYLRRNGDYCAALCVVLFCVIGLTENYLTIASYNLTLLMIADMLCNDRVLRPTSRIRSEMNRKLACAAIVLSRNDRGV